MRWTPIVSNQTDAPAPRYGHIAVSVDTRDDWGTELVILHGGVSKLPSGQEAFREDVSVFHVEQEAWLRPEIASQSSPGPRAFHAATALNKGFIFFGGQALIPNTTARTTYHDTWMLSAVGQSLFWDQGDGCESPTHPSPRSLSSLVDLGDGQVLVFGGRNESSKALNDLWILHIEEGIWENVVVMGTEPAPRIKQAMAVVDGVVWLYGGETATGTFYDDLWALRRAEGTGQWSWTQIKTKPKPVGRSGHAFTALQDGMFACFGGHTANPVYMIFSQSHTYSKEFWVLDSHRSRWVKFETPENKAAPSERVCPTMVMLSSGRLFIFGGKNKDTIMGDSWWLDLVLVPLFNKRSEWIEGSQFAFPIFPSLIIRRDVPNGHASCNQLDQLDFPVMGHAGSLLLGSVWNSIPSISTRGIFSKITTRHPDRRASPRSLTPLTSQRAMRDQEMTLVSNGHEESLRAAEQLVEGLDALYSYYDIDKESAEASLFTSQPDDHCIDSALISYAQSHDACSSEMSGLRSHEAMVATARRTLMNIDAKEFKLGSLWVLLADYKRLLLKCDVLKAWREDQISSNPRQKTRFLHFTMETLRLSDLPELLLDYRHLLEAL